MAFSLTAISVANTAGVSCYQIPEGPKQIPGFMFYNRFWFHHDRYGLTRWRQNHNPGRYLVLLPPINGATAASGTPYFTENPGDPFKAWDASGTFDYMPSQYITFAANSITARPMFVLLGSGGSYTDVLPNCSRSSKNICGSPGALVPGFRRI